MFEVHITVEPTQPVDVFKKDCAEIGVKPLLIEVQNNNYVGHQLMTTQQYKGYNWKEQLRDSQKLLEDRNYQVKRLKVEINPNVPFDMELLKYYETHFRIITTKKTEAKLEEISKQYGFHKSRNMFKKIDDEKYYLMYTFRTKKLTLAEFNLQIELFKGVLKKNGFEFDKVEVEGCIFDTNEKLDSEWLKTNKL